MAQAAEQQLPDVEAAPAAPTKRKSGGRPVQVDNRIEPERGRERGASAQVRNPHPLEERFTIKRNLISRDYLFRDQPARVAFTNGLRSLKSREHAPAVAAGMMDRAVERGWSVVRLKGSEEFKRNAWVAAEARGIAAVGYGPTRGDMEAASAERRRLLEMLRQSPQRADQDPELASAPKPRAAQLQGVDDPSKSDHERTAPGRQSLQAMAAERDQPSNHANEDLQRTPAYQRAGRSAENGYAAGEWSQSAVMKALEKLFEQERVPQQLRPGIRDAVSRELDGLARQGKQVKLRVVDKTAARQVPQAQPHFHIARQAVERAR